MFMVVQVEKHGRRPLSMQAAREQARVMMFIEALAAPVARRLPWFERRPVDVEGAGESLLDRPQPAPSARRHPGFGGGAAGPQDGAAGERRARAIDESQLARPPPAEPQIVAQRAARLLRDPPIEDEDLTGRKGGTDHRDASSTPAYRSKSATVASLAPIRAVDR